MYMLGKEKDVRKLVLISLFIALNVVFTRFLSIQTFDLRIGFGFLPSVIASMMFGPIIGGIIGIVSDLIGVILFPSGGFFPGFTLSAFLAGVIYGVGLHKKPATLIRFVIVFTIINVFINMGLNTLWISIMYNKGFLALLPTRITKELVMIPIQTVTTLFVWKHVVIKIEPQYA